jgi:transcriptional regulator with XRE-family HTH domain
MNEKVDDEFDKMLSDIFSSLLRKNRKMLKMSQERLSQMCNLSRNYISELECCKKKATMHIYWRIIAGLNIYPMDIFFQFFEELQRRSPDWQQRIVNDYARQKLEPIFLYSSTSDYWDKAMVAEESTKKKPKSSPQKKNSCA